MSSVIFPHHLPTCCRRHRLMLLTFVLLCCVIGGALPSTATAASTRYGAIAITRATWSSIEGTAAFDTRSESATATEGYNASSLTGYLFAHVGDSYRYLGTETGGRFVNDGATFNASDPTLEHLGWVVPEGHYVLYLGANGRTTTAGTGTPLDLKRGTWYKAGSFADSMADATDIVVNAGYVTVIDDAVLRRQTDMTTTRISGSLTHRTRYNEYVTARLVAPATHADTGFELVTYARSGGSFSFSDLPQGAYRFRYGVASSARPSRLHPLTVFTYEAPTTERWIAAGGTTALSHRLGSLPRRQKHPSGAARRMQETLRAKRWMDKKITYSQRRWFEGYRTDCSGFVSMLWGRGSSPTTRMWYRVGHRRATTDLVSGDVVIMLHGTPKTPYHAVMFSRWIDKDRGLFEYIHLTSRSTGGRVYQSIGTWNAGGDLYKGYAVKYPSKLAHY